MKNRCYPKFSYILMMVLAMVEFAFAAGPFFFQTNEGALFKIIWCSSMSLFGVILLLGAIQYMQYYYFEGDDIVVRSLFGIVVKLNIHRVNTYIECLPTYSYSGIHEKWICIYDESIQGRSPRFKSGCSNSKKHKRIQIILTEKNLSIIKQHLEIKKDKVAEYLSRVR